MPERQRLLELALKGLEAERLKIDDEISQIRTQLGHQPSTTNQHEGGNQATASRKKKRRMSAEARRKISEAMKRRYAELRKIAKK